MKIDAVELGLVRLQLKGPFSTSFGTILNRSCIIVQIHGEGITGLSECVAFDDPWYSYETITTAWHILEDYLIPRVVGSDVTSAEELWERFVDIRGHNMAKAGLDMAAWDLFAKAEGVSLATLLGGTRDRVAVGVSIGIQASPEELVNTASGYLGQGYRRLKLKVGPGRDVPFICEARRAFPETMLQIDANSAYSLADVRIFQAMDDLDLLLIEQPLGPDDIVDHAQLQRHLKTPICLDESIHSSDDARHALELGSARIINIKAGRVGGHTQSRRIHDYCYAKGKAVWCGGMLETNIGRAHNVALASLSGFTLPGDISASARYYDKDIAAPDFDLNADSTLTVPTKPGIGVELDPGIAWDRHQVFTHT